MFGDTRAPVKPLDLPKLARAAEAACDRARVEILPRFRNVAVEIKKDGSPVTEADRAAEQAIRAVLREALPEAAILGEEFGAEGSDATLQWVIDPIDGTIAFTRGIPLFGTLLALMQDGEPVLGVIDCCAIDERTVGWKGGGCFRNGAPIRASGATDLRRAIVSHGDVFCFDRAGKRAFFERMVREIPMLRGYTDAFGHAHTCAGGIDAMVDLDLNPWDMAATRILVTEAGGRCRMTPKQENGKAGLVFGAPALVEQLCGWLGL
jgi:histidinol phosphatase-like enzyme (inositol monophosphatase family)